MSMSLYVHFNVCLYLYLYAHAYVYQGCSQIMFRFDPPPPLFFSQLLSCLVLSYLIYCLVPCTACFTLSIVYYLVVLSCLCLAYVLPYLVFVLSWSRHVFVLYFVFLLLSCVFLVLSCCAQILQVADAQIRSFEMDICLQLTLEQRQYPCSAYNTTVIKTFLEWILYI